MLLNSHILAFARCLAGKVCGLVRSTWRNSQGEDKLGARDKILNTKVADRACAGRTPGKHSLLNPSPRSQPFPETPLSNQPRSIKQKSVKHKVPLTAPLFPFGTISSLSNRCCLGAWSGRFKLLALKAGGLTKRVPPIKGGPQFPLAVACIIFLQMQSSQYGPLYILRHVTIHYPAPHTPHPIPE